MLAFSHPATGAGVGLFPGPAQAEPCGSIKGGAFQSNWGMVNSRIATTGDPSALGDAYYAENAYYAIHGPLLARAIKADLRPSRGSAHEGHEAPGDSITFNVDLDINYQVGGLIPLGLPTCGYLINLDPPLQSGELPPARVWWKVASVFRDHGTFQDVRGHAFDGSSPTETDPSGKPSITFQARQEPTNGQGQEKSLRATVRASFDPRAWIASMGLTDPRLLAFLPAAIDVSTPESVTLEWHEQVAYKVDGPFGESRIFGEICSLEVPFTLNWDSGVGLAGTVTFSPTSNNGGTWSLEGAMASVGVTNAGEGSYAIQSSTENVPTSLIMNGTGSQTTAGFGTTNFPVNNQVIELAPSQCSQP